MLATKLWKVMVFLNTKNIKAEILFLIRDVCNLQAQIILFQEYGVWGGQNEKSIMHVYNSEFAQLWLQA